MAGAGILYQRKHDRNAAYARKTCTERSLCLLSILLSSQVSVVICTANVCGSKLLFIQAAMDCSATNDNPHDKIETRGNVL